MSIRHIIGSALLVSAALTLTACGPDDNAGTGASGSSSAKPAASAPADNGSNAPGGSASKGKGRVGKDGLERDDAGCPVLAKGHKLIWVNNVEGAMANIVAKDAAVSCNKEMNEGAFYRQVGGLKTYGYTLGSKVTVIGKNGPEVRTAKEGPQTGIAHVKECANRQGNSYDAGQDTNGGKEYCAGQNYYEVGFGADHKINEMTELYGS